MKGSLGLPGGHLEFSESFERCAARELVEETGIVVKEGDITFMTAVNSVFEEEGKHYVTIAMGCFVEADVEAEVCLFFSFFLISIPWRTGFCGVYFNVCLGP